MQARGRALVLNVTKACNLACRYCFSRNEAGAMPPEIVRAAERAIPWEGGAPASVSFFGGEPLLAWSAIEYAVEAFPRARFHVTTNATLIDEAMIRLFRLKRFSFIVSVDGPEALHDAQRVRPDGSGSWRETLNGLLKLREAGLGRRVTLRGTYTIEAPHLAERLAALNELADRGLASAVALEPAEVPGSQYTDEDWARLAAEYERAVEHLVRRRLEDRPARWRHVEKVFRRIVRHDRHIATCGGGVGYFTLNPRGEIFACHREGDTRVGHVETGLDPELVRAWTSSRTVDQKPQCRTCGLAYICGGSCRYAGVANCGSLLCAGETDCRTRHLTARVAWQLASDRARRALFEPWLGKAKG